LIQTPAASALDLAPVEGGVEHVLGDGLTPFATPGHGGLAGASVLGVYSSCYGPVQQFAASVVATTTGGGPPSHDRALQLPAATVASAGSAGAGGVTSPTAVPSAQLTVSPTARDPRSPASSHGAVDLPFGLGPLDIKVTGNPLVVWLSVATAVLVALGVLVNLEVLRRWLWSITGARLIARWRSHGTA